MLKLVAAAALSLALVGLPARAAGPVPDTAPVTIEGARQFDLVSKVNGRAYRVFVATPAQAPPKGGFPVLYVLDGNAYFATAAATAGLQAFSPGMGPMVVVGIGYPVNDRMEIEKRRAFDLTPPAPSDVAALMPGTKPSDYGGLDAFLKVIETEIEPEVAALAPVNPAEATLFGHSFGGLAVLHELFVHPAAFRGYVAVSPSLFWDNRSVLRDEPGFVAQVTSGKVAPRVLIMAGAEEAALWTKLPPGNPFTLDQINGFVRTLRMVDNARDLATRLAAVKGGRGYKVTGIVLPDEGHLSEPPAALSRAVRTLYAAP
jgi:predicted alpha/beta superfamily hydrolase